MGLLLVVIVLKLWYSQLLLIDCRINILHAFVFRFPDTFYFGFFKGHKTESNNFTFNCKKNQEVKRQKALNDNDTKKITYLPNIKSELNNWFMHYRNIAVHIRRNCSKCVRLLTIRSWIKGNKFDKQIYCKSCIIITLTLVCGVIGVIYAKQESSRNFVKGQIIGI